jgi:hypothetical protein
MLPTRNRRRILIRTGAVLFALGALPLLVYCVIDSITGDPKNPGNPVGLGLLFVMIGGPGFLLAMIGFCLPPRAEGAP